MLADCLGVKVSVGEFSLQLGAPTVKIENASVVATYAVDSLAFSAFKLRFRPDLTDAAQPCHFSGRVELGGEARDMRVTLRYNPLVDVQHCKVGDPGRLDVDLDIGYLNLGPVPPGIADLENPFKDMVADALNGAFFAAEAMADLPAPVAALLALESKSLDQVLSKMCGDAYSQATNVLTSSADAALGGAENGATAAVGSAASSVAATNGAPGSGAGAGTGRLSPGGVGAPPPITPCCGVKANAALTGRLGRIVVTFPKAPKPVTARLELRGPDGKVVKSVYGDVAMELLPGTYSVAINGVEVQGVAVRAGFDTQVRVGALHTHGSKSTRFEFFTPGGTAPVRSDYGEAALGFPAGRIEVGVAGQRAPVTIEDGRITEF